MTSLGILTRLMVLSSLLKVFGLETMILPPILSWVLEVAVVI